MRDGTITFFCPNLHIPYINEVRIWSRKSWWSGIRHELAPNCLCKKLLQIWPACICVSLISGCHPGELVHYTWVKDIKISTSSKKKKRIGVKITFTSVLQKVSNILFTWWLHFHGTHQTPLFFTPLGPRFCNQNHSICLLD